MSDGNGKHLEFFKTSSVCDITGLSATVLRAWERRYGFLMPERLPGGHRLYTREDLSVLQRVKELTDCGYSVGELAEHGRDWLLGIAGREPAQDWKSEAAGLISSELPCYRLDRYRGEGLGVRLDVLGPHDLATVVVLYEAVSSIYELWRYMDRDARDVVLLWRRLETAFSAELFGRLTRLGSLSRPSSKLGATAIEDAKFGALGALKAIVEDKANRSEEALLSAVTLCRDHSKMLRNAFVDIDVTIRAADESSKVHSVKSLVSKLTRPPHFIEVHVESDCAVSSRCLETSALDRILYSFLRKLSDAKVGKVRLWAGQVSDKLLRFAFCSELESPVYLSDDELASTAVGLSVGVSGQAALQQGFLGSSGRWTWFHWPLLEVGPDAHLCDCEI